MRNYFLLALAISALTAQAKDADGWKTILATEQDLKDYPAKQVNLEDGLLHVRSGNGILIPQPSPDGAIRARLHFRERTGFPQLRIRRSGNGLAKNTDYYEFILMIKTGQTSIMEGYVNVTTRGKGKRVGVVPLAEPFTLGSYVDLELSMVGEHLQMLVNGKVAFETNDSTVSTGGYWGVACLEAWFSNIQVRSLPRGLTPGQSAPTNQLAKSTDPRVIQLEETYAAAIQREVTPAHLEDVKALNAKYVAALDRALEVATQAGNLDSAVALRTEKKRVEAAAPLPADESTVDEPLNSLRMIYRTHLIELATLNEQRLQTWREKFLQAMDAYQDELTRGKNLDGALEVRKRREFEAAKGKAP